MDPPMQSLTLETSLELRRIDEVTFENVHQPWIWHRNKVVPGGWLMSQCVAAAYNTIDNGFVLDNLHTQFLVRARPDPPLRLSVKELSNGKRFAVRHVIASQDGKAVVATTATFVSTAAKTKPDMKHRVKRETKQTISEIDLDDLVPKTSRGPFMMFQRLAVHHPHPVEQKPENAIAVCAAHVAPAMERPSGHLSHILGLVNLSDYHVLDAPLQIYGITFGFFALNDYTRKETDYQAKMMTSLNHTIHIHRHDGWRVDEMCYIEAKTPCANDGRTMVETKIFDRQGVLIATCVQETLHVLKPEVQISKL